MTSRFIILHFTASATTLPMSTFSNSKSTTRTVLIGDIHGCFREFLELLIAVEWQPSTDRLILLGDLVGKGPEVKNVLNFCSRLKLECVKGNFEDNWIKWKREGRKLKSPGDAETAASLDADDWAYIESLPTYIKLPEFNSIACHGGLVPGIALEKQDPWMVMNLRTINAEGKPNSEYENDESLWAKKWKGPEHVYFGHDAMRGLQKESFATGLDTGCVYGGKLTAIILPEKKLVQVPARKMYSKPSPKM